MTSVFDIYRGLFCLGISSFSAYITYSYSYELINEPYKEHNYLVRTNNNLMRIFFIFDLLVMFLNRSTFRKDLFIHHMICLTLYMGSTDIGLAFVSLCEIFSALNWSTHKQAILWWKLATLLFVRFPVWMCTITFIANATPYSYHFWVYRICPIVMISLDMYWLKQLCKRLFHKHPSI